MCFIDAIGDPIKFWPVCEWGWFVVARAIVAIVTKWRTTILFDKDKESSIMGSQISETHARSLNPNL